MSDSDSTSNVNTFATERSFEMEDLSPPECSPISQNHRGPELYQFEPLAQQAAAGDNGDGGLLLASILASSKIVMAGFLPKDCSHSSIFKIVGVRQK